MIRHKTECPRCGSREVRQRPKGFWRDLDQTVRMSLGSGWGVKFAIRRAYVCTACGFLEEFIEDEQALQYIADHWPAPEA